MNEVIRAARAARDETTAAAMVAWYAASGCAMYPVDAAVCREVWPALSTDAQPRGPTFDVSRGGSGGHLVSTGGRVYAFFPYTAFGANAYTVVDVGGE